MCPDGISYFGLADRMPLYSFPTHASAKEGATAIPTIRLQMCKQLLPIGNGFSAPALSPHSGSIDALADPLICVSAHTASWMGWTAQREIFGTSLAPKALNAVFAVCKDVKRKKLVRGFEPRTC